MSSSPSSSSSESKSTIPSLSGDLFSMGFAEQRDGEKLGQMLSEFNTLAVIFDTPSAQFVDSSRQLVSLKILNELNKKVSVHMNSLIQLIN